MEPRIVRVDVDFLSSPVEMAVVCGQCPCTRAPSKPRACAAPAPNAKVISPGEISGLGNESMNVSPDQMCQPGRITVDRCAGSIACRLDPQRPIEWLSMFGVGAEVMRHGPGVGGRLRDVEQADPRRLFGADLRLGCAPGADLALQEFGTHSFREHGELFVGEDRDADSKIGD